MQNAIRHWFRSVWRDVNDLRVAQMARNERRQVELTCREHGMLWLVDKRYADAIAVPAPIERRRKATR